MAVLAFLFAPARDQSPSRVLPDVKESVAYVLAPTFREAIVAVGPKITSHHLQVINQRSRPDSVSIAIPQAAAIALLFLSTALARGFRLRRSPRLISFPPQATRGPPALLTI